MRKKAPQQPDHSWHAHADPAHKHFSELETQHEEKQAKFSQKFNTENHRPAAGVNTYNIAESFTLGVLAFVGVVAAGWMTYRMVQMFPADVHTAATFLFGESESNSTVQVEI